MMILHLDDQRFITKHIRDILTDLGKLDVIYVQSVSEAKEIVASRKDEIGLILSDIIMPLEFETDKQLDYYGINTGFRFCKWIKDNYKDIPVWALTVRTDITEEELLDGGFEHSFIKPADIFSMVEQIKNRVGK